MTPRAALREIERIATSAANKAVNKTLTELKVEAIRLSSGPFKTATLRRLDHPYASRHGPLGNVALQPGNSPAIINVQTGEFRASWGVSRAKVTDSGRSGVFASGRLFNDDEKADILAEGTEVTVPRPIKEALERMAKPLLEKNLKDALSESRNGR